MIFVNFSQNSTLQYFIPFTGEVQRSPFLQNLHAIKAHKIWYKIWARCNDNGYLQQFEIYIGNKETKVFPNGLYFDIVDQLTKELWGKNHHVFFDNLYTSVHLIDSFEKAWHTCSRHSPCK